jgi:hypothetical protein
VQKHAPWADEPALRGVGRSRRYGSSRKVSACSASTPTLPTAAITNRLRACLHILPLLTQANVISIGTAELVRFSQSLLERRVCCRGSTYLAAPRLRPVWFTGGCRQEVDGTAGLPSAPEIPCASRQLRLVPCVDGSELARKIFTLRRWSVPPCVRPFDAVHMTAGHNALRGSGPVKSPHSIMQWHWWVVLIAGSTGAALRAVRPPNFHITPDVGASSFTPRARWVPYSARSWPSWPTPFLRSCWRARSRRLWWAGALTMR